MSSVGILFAHAQIQRHVSHAPSSRRAKLPQPLRSPQQLSQRRCSATTGCSLSHSQPVSSPLLQCRSAVEFQHRLQAHRQHHQQQRSQLLGPQQHQRHRQRLPTAASASKKDDIPETPAEAVKRAGESLKETGQTATEALEEAAEKVTLQTRSEDDIPPFDLPTAVAMGVCSFEAYNEPGPMVGVRESSETGTQTVYMDRSFLLERIVGVLQVHVRWGAGLFPPRSDSSQDEDSKAAWKEWHKRRKQFSPYCTVAVGTSAAVSRPVSKSQDAQWRETLFLYVRDTKADLVVKAFDDASDEPPGQKEPVAQASTPLEPLCDGEIQDVRLELGPAGTVDLSVHYTPLSEDSLDGLQEKAVSQMIFDDWTSASEDDEDSEAAGWFDTSKRLWQISSKLFSEPEPRIRREEANRFADNTAPDRPEFKEWCELLDGVVSRELTTRAEPLAFIANPETDTELWVYRNKEQRDVIFAFRGTSSPKDMITDMSVELQPFAPGEHAEQPSPDDLAEELSSDSKLAPVVEKLNEMENWVGKLTGGNLEKLGLAKWVTSQAQMMYASEHDQVWVHKGFLTAYQSVAPRLLALAEEVMEGDEPWKLYSTGHSMGGALATLFAYELANHKFEKAPQPEIFMYGFGSPRVGNIPFAENFDKLVYNAWRISNANDIVTKVPSLLGFKHIGVEVRLMEEGKVAVKRGTFDEIREGAAFGDLMDTIRDGAFGNNKQLQKEFKEIVKAEMETAKTLFKGNAIKEHMEDYYCMAVKACVEAGGDKCEAVMVAREAVEEAIQEEAEGGSGGSNGSGKDGGSEDSKRENNGKEESPTAQADADGSGSGGRTKGARRGGAIRGSVGGEGSTSRQHGDDESSGGEDDGDDDSVESCDSIDSGSDASSVSSRESS